MQRPVASMGSPELLSTGNFSGLLKGQGYAPWKHRKRAPASIKLSQSVQEPGSF